MPYWMSTKSPPNLYRPYRTPELDAYIRETAGVDPAILGRDLGMQTSRVRAYQRLLGVRAIAGHTKRRPTSRAIIVAGG
jgi:hypothetical protein